MLSIGSERCSFLSPSFPWAPIISFKHHAPAAVLWVLVTLLHLARAENNSYWNCDECHPWTSLPLLHCAALASLASEPHWYWSCQFLIDRCISFNLPPLKAMLIALGSLVLSPLRRSNLLNLCGTYWYLLLSLLFFISFHSFWSYWNQSWDHVSPQTHE